MSRKERQLIEEMQERLKKLESKEKARHNTLVGVAVRHIIAPDGVQAFGSSMIIRPPSQEKQDIPGYWFLIAKEPENKEYMQDRCAQALMNAIQASLSSLSMLQELGNEIVYYLPEEFSGLASYLQLHTTGENEEEVDNSFLEELIYSSDLRSRAQELRTAFGGLHFSSRRFISFTTTSDGEVAQKTHISALLLIPVPQEEE